MHGTAYAFVPDLVPAAALPPSIPTARPASDSAPVPADLGALLIPEPTAHGQAAFFLVLVRQLATALAAPDPVRPDHAPRTLADLTALAADPLALQQAVEDAARRPSGGRIASEILHAPDDTRATVLLLLRTVLTHPGHPYRRPRPTATAAPAGPAARTAARPARTPTQAARPLVPPVGAPVWLVRLCVADRTWDVDQAERLGSLLADTRLRARPNGRVDLGGIALPPPRLGLAALLPGRHRAAHGAWLSAAEAARTEADALAPILAALEAELGLPPDE